MARRRPSPRVATQVCVPPKTQVASYFSTRVSLSSSVSTNCRDQHRPRPEVAYPYSHVHRLALTVGEHLLGDPDLLAHGIVDRVPGAPLFSADLALLARDRLSTTASGTSLLSRWPGGGVSGREEAGGKARPLRWFPTVRLPGNGLADNAPRTGSRALAVVGVLGKRVDNHRAQRDDHHREYRSRRDDK
jgi:hypothetical protein